MNSKNLLKTVFIAFLAFKVITLYGQNNAYIQIINSGDYKSALGQILLKIHDIYSKRAGDKRIPSDYLSINSTESEVDLIELFRNRKERGFFIEDNPELAELHQYAGLCYLKLGSRKDSLNHYIQSLRFRKVVFERDDEIYYQISQVFKSLDQKIYFKGYIDALEQAYSLNSSKYEYSYELGMALIPTAEKKKAIYHLERYLDLSGKTDEKVLLSIAGLYEGIGRYIEAEKYYNEYLKLKPDDVNIMFAAGYIAYFRTGNYTLADFMFQGVLQKAPETDLYRRAKANEYLGDMALSNLEYDKAAAYYINTIAFHVKTEEMIAEKEKQKKEIDGRITDLKINLLNNKDQMKYDEYKNLLDEYEQLTGDLGEIEGELQQLNYNLRQLMPGKVNWNLGLVYEKKKAYSEAIKYYRAAMKYEYNAGEAREIIKKLQLKINRGY